jgi:hypothetical protein
MSLNTAHKLLGSTTFPAITCGKGNILCHRNSLFQPVQEWLQSCRVELETPIGQGSNSTSLLGQFHHGLLYLRHRHLSWPTFVDTLPNLVVTPSNSFAQILRLPHELRLGQLQHGLHNRQIQHRTAFRVQGAQGFVLAGVCFTRAYPSSKPKASTTLSLNQSDSTQAAQYCCHVPSILQGNLQHYVLFKPDTELAQFHSNPINLGYVTTPK